MSGRLPTRLSSAWSNWQRQTCPAPVFIHVDLNIRNEAIRVLGYNGIGLTVQDRSAPYAHILSASRPGMVNEILSQGIDGENPPANLLLHLLFTCEELEDVIAWTRKGIVRMDLTYEGSIVSDAAMNMIWSCILAATSSLSSSISCSALTMA